MISKIEEAGAEIRESGVLTKWFKGCDEEIKKVAELVNGVYFPSYSRKGSMPIWSVPRFSARVSLRFFFEARRALHSLFAQARRCMKN